MKNLLYIFLMIIVLGACTEDDGNYDYIEPGEIDFSAMPDAIDAMLGENLSIKGDIQTSADLNDLEFVWYTIGDAAPREIGKKDTLSTEKDLNITVSLPPGAGMRLNYQVYNRKLNVHYEKIIRVNVETAFSTGWGFITDKGDATDYSFIAELQDTVIYYKDAISLIDGESVQGKGIELFYHWYGYSGSGNFSYAIILTETGGSYYDAYSLHKQQDLMDLWNSTNYLDLPFTGAYIDFYANTYSDPYLIANGKLYPKDSRNIEDGFWELPVEGDYEISGPMVLSDKERIIFFDAKNKRYVFTDQDYYNKDVWTIKEISITNPENYAFDPANLNKDLVWMANNVPYGESLYDYITISAVLKDDEGKFYMQVFSDSYSDGFLPLVEEELPAGMVDDNSVYAVNGNYPYNYISQGNVVHRFNRNTKAFDSNYIDNLEGVITDMCTDTYGERLGVVVDNGAGSKVVIIDLLNGETVLETYESADKIIDLKYKYDVK